MKIILVVTDQKGKNIGFVSDDTRAYSLEETFRLIKSGKLDARIVKGSSGNYVRSMSNTDGKDNFDYISVSGRDIISYVQETSHSVSTPPITHYLERYLASLKEGQAFIIPFGKNKFLKVLTVDVKDKIVPHAPIIAAAAKEFDIDQYLLGAIIIDELARLLPFEEIVNQLGAQIVGMNVSIGVAQVKIDTANQLIKKGLYNPNPADKKLPFKGVLSNKDRIHLYEYLIQPKHNIRFAAARMRDLIDEWSKAIDISEKPEIIATLYPRIYKPPHTNPESSERGNQIATEFYKLSKEWIS